MALPKSALERLAASIVETATAGIGQLVVGNKDGSALSTGGGGGAMTVADGADVAEGATTDASTANTVIGRLKKILSVIPAALGSTTGSASLPVVIASDQAAVPVTPAGNVASGATDSGNPVKVGGVYNSTLPTLTNGQRGDNQLSAKGSQLVSIIKNDGTAVSMNVEGAFGVTHRSTTNNAGDGQNANSQGLCDISSNGFRWVTREEVFNGSTFDRKRGNVDSTLLSSAARTATTNGADQTNYNGKGVLLILNVTANPGGGETLSLKVQAKDPVSGNYIDIADAGVLFTAANGTIGLLVYPGTIAADLVTAALKGKSGVIPRTFRAVVTHSASGSWTYSLGQTILY